MYAIITYLIFSQRFSVVASDHGRPSRSASASVIITVQDVNDNDPVFRPKVYKANVAEDSAPGSPIISVTASDPDENSRIFYQVSLFRSLKKFCTSLKKNKKLLYYGLVFRLPRVTIEASSM